ncbi:MAG: YidC/Oxa1 family rane protein insertase [Thermoleophilaceae bacterium]|nr:YidC/Oxa1 family rane protein insertase [Thermoleophilaceae bacterium]
MLIFANILQPLIDVNDAIVKFFHDTIGLGWGLSIIGLTMAVRLAILPLTYRQVRSMQGLQKLQPEMKKIQARYKEDKKRQQEEMMKLYQEHQINPLGSCLPLLLQLPFFFGLYQTLKAGGAISDQIKHSAGKGFLFIPDLTEKVNKHTGVLIALLIIYLVTQLASSYVSSVNIQDPMQRRLLFLFPLVFSVIIIQFPAGLIVYWITTNLWTVGQQLFIRRFLPPPTPAVAGAPSGTGGRGRDSDGKPAPASGPSSPKRPKDRGGAKADSGGSPRRKRSRGGDGASGDGGSGDGGNGGPRKAPPPSPRKKKKRSGRRR